MARYSSILSLRPILTVGKCLACCSLRRPPFFSLGGGGKRPSFLRVSFHDPEVKEVLFVRITLQLFGFTLSLVHCAQKMHASCCNAGNIFVSLWIFLSRSCSTNGRCLSPRWRKRTLLYQTTCSNDTIQCQGIFIAAAPAILAGMKKETGALPLPSLCAHTNVHSMVPRVL